MRRNTPALLSATTMVVACRSANATVSQRVHSPTFLRPSSPPCCMSSLISGKTTVNSCMMMLALMYGVMPIGEHGEALQRAAREESQEVQELALIEDGLPLRDVDVRDSGRAP